MQKLFGWEVFQATYPLSSVMPCLREWYREHVVRPAERLQVKLRDRADEIRQEWPELSVDEAMDDALAELLAGQEN